MVVVNSRELKEEAGHILEVNVEPYWNSPVTDGEIILKLICLIWGLS